MPGDAEAMYRNWASDSNVTKYLTWSAHSSPESTAKLIELWIKEYENPEKYEWAICLDDIEEVIGSISLMEINDRAGRAEAVTVSAALIGEKGL